MGGGGFRIATARHDADFDVKVAPLLRKLSRRAQSDTQKIKSLAANLKPTENQDGEA